jgi:hypothetical protein
MSPYRITLLKPDGSVDSERIFECEHDDHAIDRAGEIDHPHEMLVHQAERYVTRFPPAGAPFTSSRRR